jgi:hypothetical protein
LLGVPDDPVPGERRSDEASSAAGRRSIVGRLACAVVAGVVVHLLLFNAGKDDSDPPVCHSLPGYVVPCGNLSYAAGAGTAGLVTVVLLWNPARGVRRADETDE